MDKQKQKVNNDSSWGWVFVTLTIILTIWVMILYSDYKKLNEENERLTEEFYSIILERLPGDCVMNPYGIAHGLTGKECFELVRDINDGREVNFRVSDFGYGDATLKIKNRDFLNSLLEKRYTCPINFEEEGNYSFNNGALISPSGKEINCKEIQ